MTDKAEKLHAILQQDGMTVGQFAAMWQVPPWKADCRLRKLVKDGTVITGNIIRESKDSEGDIQERSVEAFALNEL